MTTTLNTRTPRRTTTSTIVAMTAAAGLATAASAQYGNSNTNNSTNTSEQTDRASDSQSNRPGEKDIQRAVKRELRNDPVVNANKIDVTMSNGRITLEGEADLLYDSIRAGSIAAAVAGVERLQNNITITESKRSTGEIRRTVSKQLENQPTLDADTLDISVARDGTISVDGEVSTHAARRLAYAELATIDGVTDIDMSGVSIDMSDTPSDAELQSLLTAALEWNATIDSGSVVVSTSGGDVDLRGVVGSLAEKKAAIDLAYDAGAETVTAGDLRIESWARSDRSRSNARVRSDDQIARAVKGAIALRPGIDGTRIEVEADEGEVELEGEVRFLVDRISAAAIAREIAGVRRVENDIDVEPALDVADDLIEQRIESSLDANALIDGALIDVAVDDGEVTLRGQTESLLTRAIVHRAVAQTPTVTEIENRLVVEETDQSLLFVNPHEDSLLYAFADAEPVTDRRPVTTTGDAEILEEINEELFWSPFVDSDEVVVVVENGIATLDGTLDSDAERRAAIENAYEGGAVAVRDNLDVFIGPSEIPPGG